MIYAYARVSSDRQSLDNQKFEIFKYSQNNNLKISEWVEESTSSRTKLEERLLFDLLKKVKKNDKIIITEISRLGRSLMEIMSILNDLMTRDIKVYSIKEGYELGNNINSKVLAFAFGLSAEIERDLISQRTKEALAKKKAEGIHCGRKLGSLGKSQFTEKQALIEELLKKDVPIGSIAKILEAPRSTLHHFVRSRKLKPKKSI